MFPFIHITPGIAIPTYYLIISFALCVALLWVVRRAQAFHLSEKITLDLSLIIMVAGFLGARLFHIFYESPDYYQNHWTRTLEFWNGGFVFYGGALAAGFFGILFLHRRTSGLYEGYLDLVAPVLSFTYILGRIACFFTGCCYGRFCDLPWAISGRHPTQLYAVIWELGTILILLGCEKIPPKNRRPSFLGKSGGVFYLWMILHSLGRILMESYRDDFRGPRWGFSISTWISVAICLLGFYLILRKPTRRGTTDIP